MAVSVIRRIRILGEYGTIIILGKQERNRC